VAPLVATLQKRAEDAGVRGMSAEALGYIGDRRAVRALVEALGDPAAEVRRWAAFACGELGDARALPALRRLAAQSATQSARRSLMTEAAAAIRRIKARGIERS
jgi:HEAT repeat protein